MSPIEATAWDALERLSIDPAKSITWASRGGDGSGKSYFACTAPDPIFVCAFDPYGVDRVDPDLRATKDIRIGRYSFAHIKADKATKEQKKAAAAEVWERFVEDYKTALKHARTIHWDREDLAWELKRYASWGNDKGSGSKTGQLDYGELNTEYVGLIQLAKPAGVNLGLLQGLCEEWVSKFDPQSASMKRYNTGKLVPDGFSKIPDHVDMTLLHFWSPEKRTYMQKVGKFPNKDVRDLEFPNDELGFPALDFATMATLAFPTTDRQDWQ